MSARRSVILQILAVALAIAMSACVLPFLRRPFAEEIGPLSVGPLLLLATVGVSFAAAGRGPSARGLIAALGVASVFFVVEHGITLGSALFGFFSVRPLLALAFGFFAGIAPIVARVEQNPWFGVRTPWTLGSRRVWRETHRATARLWLVGGVVGSALTMFGAPFGLVVFLLVALILAPAGISYGVWRKLGRP